MDYNNYLFSSFSSIWTIDCRLGRTGIVGSDGSPMGGGGGSVNGGGGRRVEDWGIDNGGGGGGGGRVGVIPPAA